MDLDAEVVAVDFEVGADGVFVLFKEEDAFEDDSVTLAEL